MNRSTPRHTLKPQHWRVPAALALMLASSAAFALGLGDIKVKSRPGQPLVAEIPVVSSDPAEMEHLSARLASGDTFERVGLQRPAGVVRELNFAIGLSDDGKPVIRVTSATPVTQAMVDFLIEVDWGQGRLVREYSALVNGPGTVAATSEPQIEAPEAAPGNTIARVPETAPAAMESLPPAPVAPPMPAAPQPAPQQAASMPQPALAAPEPAPAPRVARAPSPSTHALVKASAKALKAGGRTTVRSGQTLSGIAAQLGDGYSLDQTMLALLRANPDAFIKGNINLLKAGAVLKLPPSAESASLDRTDASAMVRQQMADWRDWKQFRKPLPQPLSGALAKAAPVAGKPVNPPAPATTKTQTNDPPAAQARLEIAPAAADAGKRKGTTSGTTAGGKGDMLANMQQAKEDLAARDAEVQELKSQLAELEKIKQDQAKLLAMKDSDLAAAQHNLGKAEVHAQTPTAWLWGGLGLLLLGLGIGWLIARSRGKQPVKSKKFDASKLAPIPTNAKTGELFAREAPAEIAPVQPPVAPLGKPTWHTGDAAINVSLNQAPAGRERLELALAYKEIGDLVTTRTLLNEVLAGTDEEARAEAAQLLRELD